MSLGVPQIEHWNAETDGELNAANMMNKLERQGYICTPYTFTKGTYFPDHTHNVTKKDAIVAGVFQFTMLGKTVVLHPGDTVEVPKGTVHSAEVVGEESVTFIDAHES